MDIDSSYDDDSWRMDQQPYAFGLLDDTAPTYDPADSLPDPAPFIGPSSGMADDVQGYAQLYVDTLNEEGVRQMLDALLPLVSEQAAMPTPALGTSAAASLQHDDATVDPRVLRTDEESISMDVTPTSDDDEPPSPLTEESTPGLSYDATSFAASPLPDTPVEAAAEQAASRRPSDDSTPAEPGGRAVESTPVANKTVKRSTKRARTPDYDYEPSAMQQTKKRKTKRSPGSGAVAQTSAGDDLGNSHVASNPSAEVQASPPPSPSPSNQDDRTEAKHREANQPGQQKVRKAKRRPGKSNAGAVPGSNAQTKNNDKSRPARAIHKYAYDVERRKGSFRVALRILRQPDTVRVFPRALPSKLADDVKKAIQAHIDGQPDVARSGDDEWVECGKCKEEYGILERVLKDQESEHKYDCHDVSCCVVCGCPVVRGDLEQWRKHRKSNCPPWRVAVKLDKHVEWLETNGLLDAAKKVYHRQFFDKKVRDSADRVQDVEARRTLLVDALKAKELAKLPKTVHSNEPFKGMIAKKVLAALEREIDSESAEA